MNLCKARRDHSIGWRKAFQAKVGMAGFEPAFSCSQGRRIARLSHIPEDSLSRVPREGIEPSSPP